jgi:MYXO-CTERM domain-containing protein
MALCDGEGGEQNYRDAFFPCGTSVGEMLQPDYRACQELAPSERVEPPAECYRYRNTEFAYADADVRAIRAAATEPNIDAALCQPVSLETVVDGDFDFVGSPSLSYPPELVDPRFAPVCANPSIPGIHGDISADAWGQGGGDSAAGCSATSRPAPGSPLPLLLGLGVAALLRARRK